jgi:hypothetical protein
MCPNNVVCFIDLGLEPLDVERSERGIASKSHAQHERLCSRRRRRESRNFNASHQWSIIFVFVWLLPIFEEIWLYGLIAQMVEHRTYVVTIYARVPSSILGRSNGFWSLEPDPLFFVVNCA